MTRSRNLSRIVLIAGVLAASCTMKDQEAPPLTGPSEFGTSITVAVSPDVLEQNGFARSTVTVTVRDANGQPLPNRQMRAEIIVNDLPADFGLLSARNIVSGADGRAIFYYTAPANMSGVESVVDIAVTPIVNSFGEHVTRKARIRLVPPGIVLPPSGLTPAFTVAPLQPAEGQLVFFSARTSTAPANNPIVTYAWNFGDGSSGSGLDTTHAFDTAGTFFVRLTVSDAVGRSASTTQSVTVGQAPAPTAQFVFSPQNPQPGDEVTFNASASIATAGRRIVSYAWDFGDGSTATGSSPLATRRYTVPRVYNVTLTVTDDIGRTATTTNPVEVALPDDDGGGSQN
jgi:hypothetical protein